MIIQLFKKFFNYDLISNLSIEEIEILKLPRSPLWKNLRDEHIKKNPRCSVCNNLKNVVPHHIVPFHIDPALELDPNNLISLCEGETFNCHLFFGHFRNWTKYNPTVTEDALNWNKKINNFGIL